MSSAGFFRRFVGAATPGTLGAIRAFTCLILLISTAWEDLSSIALLPPEIRHPMGAMNLLYALPTGYERFLGSETSLWLFQRLTEVVLFLGVIGWHTRIVIPVATLSAFVLNGIMREYSGFWDQNLVPIYVLAVLSFTPCGDGWSLDRVLRIARGRSVPAAERPAPVYGWARYACWVVIALTYLAAGLSKVRDGGLEWVSATNIALHLAPLPDIGFVLLGIAAVAGELIFVTVLFSRLARRIVPAVTMSMHVGIVLLQNIVFADLVFLPLVFYDFSKVREAIGRRLRAGGAMDVLYDGLCPVCRRAVRILASLDIFRRLEFRDFRRLDLAEYNSSHAQRLTPADLEHEMYVVWRGRAYGGFYAYRAMAVDIPLFWPLVPVLFFPGISWLGVSVYRYIGRRRFRLLQCDAECSTEPIEAADHDVTPATAASRGVLRPALAIFRGRHRHAVLLGESDRKMPSD
jgi:predicted DCC family thiol-disulfide oxidoreductase YuxK